MPAPQGAPHHVLRPAHGRQHKGWFHPERRWGSQDPEAQPEWPLREPGLRHSVSCLGALGQPMC